MDGEQTRTTEDGRSQQAAKPLISSNPTPSVRLGPSRLYNHQRRKSRLSGGVQTATVKIEEDDGSYNLSQSIRTKPLAKEMPSTMTSGPNGVAVDEVVEKSGKISRLTQTAKFSMTSTIVSAVRNRMMQYQSAILKEDMFDKLLGGKFKQLREENEALRALAKDLKQKLQRSEEINRKRPRIESDSPNVSRRTPATNSSIQESHSRKALSTDTNGAFTTLSTSSGRPVAMVSSRSSFPTQSQSIPQTTPHMSSPYQPVAPPAHQHLAPSPRYGHEQQRYPMYAHQQMQLVPGQQPMYFHGRSPVPQAHNVNAPPGTGNSHVVPANQTPQMTSLNSVSPQYHAQPIISQNRPSGHPNGYIRYPINHGSRPLANIGWPGNGHQQPIAVPLPPLPKLKASISASTSGIILTWDYEQPENGMKYTVECYHLFAHQAKDAHVNPPTDMTSWKKIGVVNALPLPMACTLTQFATGNVYHFAVLAVDICGREGPLSNPCTIRLNLNN